jgi:signal transduction histidine kinase
VLRSLAHGSVVSPGRPVDFTRAVDRFRALGVVAGLAAVVIFTQPRPWQDGGRGVAVAITVGLSATGWIAWMLAARWPRLLIPGLVLMGGAGGVLTGLSPASAAAAVGALAAFSAGDTLRPDLSAGIAAEILAAFLGVTLATGQTTGFLAGYPIVFAGMWVLGVTRRAYRIRAYQAEETLSQTRRAHEAEAQAVALAERTRIAREVHDVLAHSLAAVAVNLQAAEGLLGAGTLPRDNPELAKAIDCVTRAGSLTRDGLAAARRAVLALREDAQPLPEQLSVLAVQYREVGDLAVEVSVTGEERPLSAEAGLAAYRTAQEALTNARKHAPGQPVRLALAYEPGQVTVSVANPLPPDGAAGQLAASGAGYGLAGLRERAALAGGSLAAGPQDGQWQVHLRIPT